MEKLTKEQAVVISAYTGFLACDFADLHAYVEKVMGRPVFTHEMASKAFEARLREACKADFLALIPEAGNGR